MYVQDSKRNTPDRCITTFYRDCWFYTTIAYSPTILELTTVDQLPASLNKNSVRRELVNMTEGLY